MQRHDRGAKRRGDPINSVANTIEQLGINYLNRSAADAQESLRRDLDSQLSAADKLCA